MKPRVSVVIETITARNDASTGSLVTDLAPTLKGLAKQTYPQDLIETIVVIDAELPQSIANEVRMLYPSIELVSARQSNYFAAKNAGAQASTNEIIVLLDSDCVPRPDWMENLVSRLDDGVAVVAGKTRYSGPWLRAKTYSIPSFAIVAADEGDGATGYNINNVAYRREVLLAHPFDERIRRNGGCYLQFNQLRADGLRVLYEPRAEVAHALGNVSYVRKHFERGYDGVNVYRYDDRAVLRGTTLFRRFGALALLPITVRRIVGDWVRLVRTRSQVGIPLVAFPYFALVSISTRTIELAGGLMAVASPRRYERA